MSLEVLLHCLKAHQRLPHDGLHSGEESCIHGDEAREEVGAMLFRKFEVVKSGSWSSEVGAWEVPKLANHLNVALPWHCSQRHSNRLSNLRPS